MHLISLLLLILVYYVSECYYGNTILHDSHPVDTGCDMSCPGNASEACGGGYRLTLYQNLGYTPPAQQVQGDGNHQLTGCYTDSVFDRALQYSLIDYTSMTVERCLQAAAGYQYAALEYYGKTLF
jgi:hypothetical protein